MPMRRSGRILIAAALSLSFLAVGCASLDAAQRRWIFQASKTTTVQAPGLPADTTEVWIPVADTDERVHGWWQTRKGRVGAPAILYLHGARRTVETSAFRTRRLVEAGFDVLAIDYRGFGRSDGPLPSEEMSYADARAAWRWLEGRVPQGTPRIVYGHSIGGAIAIDLAARERSVEALVVDSSFTSLPALVSTMRYGWLPVGFLITQRFESIDKIAQVAAPKLFIHGTRDWLVPHTMSDELFEAASEPKTLLKIEGGRHSNAFSQDFERFTMAMTALTEQARRRASASFLPVAAPSSAVAISDPAAVPDRRLWR